MMLCTSNEVLQHIDEDDDISWLNPLFWHILKSHLKYDTMQIHLKSRLAKFAIPTQIHPKSRLTKFAIPTQIPLKSRLTKFAILT